MIALTPGEPAGIGLNLSIIYIQKTHQSLIAFADPDVLMARAKLLNLKLKIVEKPTTKAYELCVYPVKAQTKVVPGELNIKNTEYVLKSIKMATKFCQKNNTKLLTGPIHKGIINKSGIKFSGHTEYLAKLTKVEKAVMMLVTKNLKVALATTHLPLNKVSQNITKKSLKQVIQIIHTELKSPKISICGLNPHAGEGGYLGTEEILIINPVIQELKSLGFNLSEVISADTAFTPDNIAKTDVILAMYHDQGLPVLKALGFKKSVNVTLGLPFNRVSVDHGTALNLAISKNISLGSFNTAINYLIKS